MVTNSHRSGNGCVKLSRHGLHPLNGRAIHRFRVAGQIAEEAGCECFRKQDEISIARLERFANEAAQLQQVLPRILPAKFRLDHQDCKGVATHESGLISRFFQDACTGTTGRPE